MSLYKRILCMLLVLVICLGALAGCGTKDPGKKDPDNDESESVDGDEEDSDDESDDETETEDPRTIDEMEESYSFGDGTTQDFVILARDDTKYEYLGEGYTGDPVKQAVYERNEEVMERCNVEISLITEIGDWDNRETFSTVVRNNAMAPGSDYDLISTHAAYLMSLSLEGVGHDITDVPAINLEKRWWCEPFYRDTNYNGSIYIMVGDIGYTLYEHIEVIFFNEDMAIDLEIGDLYDVALDGDWTWEVFTENVLKVTTDLDAAEDARIYGYLSTPHAERSFPTAFEADMAQKDPDTGMFGFPMFLKDPALTAYDNLIKFVVDTPQVIFHNDYTTGAAEMNPIFAAGRSLFYGQMLGEAKFFKAEMDDDYGLLPFPKLNDSQVEYHCTVCDNLNAILVPFNVKDLTKAGVVTEMLSMVSYRTVTQEYYEEALKYQSFNNPDCVETIEMIRDSLTMTFTMAYSYYLGFPNSLVSGAIAALNDVAIGTKYAQNSIAQNNKAKEVYEKLIEMDAREIPSN